MQPPPSRSRRTPGGRLRAPSRRSVLVGSRAVAVALGFLLSIALAPASADDAVDFSGLNAARPVSFGQGLAGQRPRDGLDALLRGLPGGSPRLEEWYADNREDFRKARERGGTADVLEGSEDVFGGFFGEPSWTASTNQDVVLEVLADLTPPGDDPDRTRLLDSMLDALATRVASGKSSASERRRPRPKAPILLALRRLANSPEGIGPEYGDALREIGVTLWDYKAAAFVLMAAVEPARQEADTAWVDAFLQDPPDPAGDLDGEAILEEIERREDAASGTAKARLRLGRTRVTRVLRTRRRARRELEAILGERALTGPDLMVAAIRRAAAGNDAAQTARIRRALLDLGRAEVELGQIMEGLELPSPEEVATAADGEIFLGIDSEDLGSRIRNDLLDADVRISAKLFDLDLVPGISLSGKYRWELEGKVSERSWTRVDEWRLTGAVRIGDLLQDVFDLPFGINLDHDREVILVREFDHYADALRAVPKTPLALPLSAEKARAMDVGWFWSLPVRLQAAASLAGGYGEGLVSARGYANYVLRGRFRLNVFKEDATHVRVQLIGAHERGPGAGVDIRLAVEVFGVRILDRALDKLVDLKLLNWDHSRRRGVGIAADYLYDLEDAQARRAYDRMVKVSLTWGGLLATDPRLAAPEMQDRLLTDLRPTERLFLEDRDRPVEERRVDRRFLGTNTFRVRNTRFKIGPRLARYGTNRRWVENDLRVIHPDDRVERYDFPMYSYWSGWSLLFGYRKESRERQAFSLMRIPEGATEPVGPQGLVLAGTFRDRRARRSELEGLRDEVARAFGPRISGAMGLGDVAIPSGGKSLRAGVMLALHPEATARILDPARTSEAAVRAAAAATAAAYDRSSAASALAGDLALVRTIEGGPGNARQVTALARLADSGLWRDLGPRFLVELLGDAATAEVLHAEVGWRGKDIEPYRGVVGEPRHAELQKIVSEALSAVSDRDRPLE